MKTFVALVFFIFLFPSFSLAQSVGPEPLSASQLASPYLTGCSISIALPGGGNAYNTTSFGLRCMATERTAIAAYLQGGYEKATEKSIFGLALRGEYFLTETGRAFPFLFFQISSGQAKGQNSAGRVLSESTSGASAGLGVEVFLMPEISISAETGAAMNFAPSDSSTATTFASAAALHLHF